MKIEGLRLAVEQAKRELNGESTEEDRRGMDYCIFDDIKILR